MGRGAMRVVLFCHSLRSDWNHGNAHFLRGVVTELAVRGHDVRVLEPEGSWSAKNLAADHGEAALGLARRVYPLVRPETYDLATLDLEEVLDGASLVIVHEWSDPELVRRVGAHRKARGGYRVVFHDTHHRAVTEPRALEAYDLSGYDAVLAFGEAVREVYARRGWARAAFVWHEAADVRVFHPRVAPSREGDLVWIGNWGDDERTHELCTFLLEPARDLGLRARIHGVRYPAHAVALLRARGVTLGGWLPNFRAPDVFARFGVTVHVPRRPYVQALPGIPTIRVFEALACGIPLVSAPWSDAERLFAPGEDFLVARTGDEMRRHLRAVLSDADLARALSRRGLERIRARHTCAHRVDELLAIARGLGVPEHATKLAAQPHGATV